MSNKKEESFISEEDGLAAIQQLEGYSAQSLDNLVDGITNLLQQYSTQQQIVFDIAKSKFGVELTPPAAAYQNMIAVQTEAVELEKAIDEEEARKLDEWNEAERAKLENSEDE